MQFLSEPSGATVLDGIVSIGKTPMVRFVNAQEGRKAYRFKLEGFEDHVVSVSLDQDQRVQATLLKLATPPPGRTGKTGKGRLSKALEKVGDLKKTPF